MDGGDEMIHGLSEEEKFKVIRPINCPLCQGHFELV